jgi:uncharacterized tellurite resistance protein B-like protein
MLNALRRFITDMSTPDDVPRSDDERLAAAALLVHIMNIDGTVSREECRKLSELVKERFELSKEEAEKLIDAATVADRNAVDLYGFTTVLKAKLDEAGRSRVIEMMWEMVYADGEVHEFEDNVVWRVAELLGVPTRDRVRMKQLARGRVTT